MSTQLIKALTYTYRARSVYVPFAVHTRSEFRGWPGPDKHFPNAKKAVEEHFPKKQNSARYGEFGEWHFPESHFLTLRRFLRMALVSEHAVESWHFEKGHFTVLSALRARDFPEQKWSLAF